MCPPNSLFLLLRFNLKKVNLFSSTQLIFLIGGAFSPSLKSCCLGKTRTVGTVNSYLLNIQVVPQPQIKIQPGISEKSRLKIQELIIISLLLGYYKLGKSNESNPRENGSKLHIHLLVKSPVPRFEKRFLLATCTDVLLVL